MKRKAFLFLIFTVVLSVIADAQQHAANEVEVPQFELKGTFNEPLPVDVKLLRDIEYGKCGGRPLTMHIIMPEAKSQKPLPVIVWIHGGAWMSGNKEGGIKGLIPFAQHGYVCATIDYRLSKEARFPAQIEDSKAAIRFLRANAKTYHLDPERIGVWGSSAGAHVAALLGTSGDVKELEGNGGNPSYSSKVNAVCDWFAPTDLLAIGDDEADQLKDNSATSPESILIGGPVQENKEKARAANPITYISKDDPSFLIMHGDKDSTVPIKQSELLYNALQKQGVQATFIPVANAGHGKGFAVREIRQTVMDFFDKHLKDSNNPLTDISREKAPAFKK